MQKKVDSFEKVSIFNEFFKQQYKPISNDSTFPSSYKYHSDERLNCVNFTNNKFLKIIQPLDPNKAHGHNGVSITMLKLISITHSIFLWL